MSWYLDAYNHWCHQQRHKRRSTTIYEAPQDMLLWLLHHDVQSHPQLTALFHLYNVALCRVPLKTDARSPVTVHHYAERLHKNPIFTEHYLLTKAYNRDTLQSTIQQQHPLLDFHIKPHPTRNDTWHVIHEPPTPTAATSTHRTRPQPIQVRTCGADAAGSA